MSGEGSLFDVPPAAIGRFRVLHQVGAGTSGPVFRAVHPDTAAALAIKLFTLEATPDHASAMATDLDALVAGLPPSDGVCEPIDAGVHLGAPYLVTSFAPGDSLDVALKQFGPAALIDLVPRLRTLAHALDRAAARDVLHGAIHPRDVLVSESTTLVTGLGAWPILVRHGERIPIRRPYHAPELADSAVTAAGDRFALAVLAYEWMTGRRAPTAFVARDMAALPGVDIDALGRVFATALHADPGERYPSNEAFVTELESVEVEEIEPVFDPEPLRSPGASRRRARPQEEMPGNRLPLVAAADGDDPMPPGAPFAGRDRRDDAEPVADLRLARPAVERPDHPDVRIASEDSPPEPRHVIASVQPATDSLPTPIATGRLFQEAGQGQTAALPGRTSGGWRLAAGLLLGAILGIGAGYFAWGLNAGAPTAARDTADPASDGTGAPPPPAESATNASAVASGESTAAATAPSPGGASEGARSSSAGAGAASDTPGGNLLVRSTPPGATVFVDERRTGITPLTLQNVELGTRRVRIVHDGFTPEDRQVTLTRSRPSRSVEVRLTRRPPSTAAGSAPAGTPAANAPPAIRTGSLLIESRPVAATIVLNGRTIGVTPMTIDDLEPGTYTVQLQLITFRPITTTVRVVAGARARAAASLVSAQEPE